MSGPLLNNEIGCLLFHQTYSRERRGSGSGDMFGTLDPSALTIMLTTLMDFVGLSRMDMFDI